MAGLYGVATAAGVANNGNNTAQTVLTVLPGSANSRVRITEYAISFDGTNSANTPAKVEIGRCSSTGTSSSAVTPSKVNDPTGSLEALQTVCRKTFSAEPIYADILRTFYLPVFGGTIVIPQAPGQEDIIPGSTTAPIGIRVTANAAVNVTCTVRFEE